MKSLFRTSKNNNKNKKIPYALSSKPQRYGPGSNRAVINLMKEVSASSVGRFALHGLLMGSTEFTNKKGLFKYFKIQEVRATFLPANVTGAFNNIPVIMSWSLQSMDSAEMYMDDSAKLIPVYRTKSRTLKFLPPRTVLPVYIGSSSPDKYFDYSQFLSTDNTNNFPGWLYIYNPSTASIFFNYQAIVLFRGNDTQLPPSKTVHEENPYVDKIFTKAEFDSLREKDIIPEDIDDGGPEDIKVEKSIILEDSEEDKQQEIQKLKEKIQEMQKQLDEKVKIEEEKVDEQSISRKNKPK